MANKQPDKVGIHCSLCCQVKVISTNFCSNTYLCSQVAHMHIMFLRIEYNVYIITIMGQLRWHNRGSFTPHLSYFYVKTRWFVGRGCHRQHTEQFRITFSKIEKQRIRLKLQEHKYQVHLAYDSKIKIWPNFQLTKIQCNRQHCILRQKPTHATKFLR